MSRVREALKMAHDWEGKAVFTGEREAQPAVGSRFSGPSLPFIPEPVRARPSRSPRWLRRLKRRMGLGRVQVAPRCIGTTRRGDPCRAPAMDNGYCRMHGGARGSETPARAAHEPVVAFAMHGGADGTETPAQAAHEPVETFTGTAFARLQNTVSTLARSLRSRLKRPA